MVIDHISFAVKDLEEGISYWNRVFGYSQLTGIVVNSRQLVMSVFISKDASITIQFFYLNSNNTYICN